MKKHVLMIAAALLLGAMSFAQGAGPKGGAPGAAGQGKGQGKGGGMMRMGGARGEIEKKVFAQLGLNAAQKTKVAALQKSQQDKVKAAFAGMKPPAQGQKPDQATMQKMQATMKKLRDGYQTGLKGILTPAQYTKYQTLMKAEMDKWRKDHPGGPGGKPGGGGGEGKAGKKPPL